MVIAERSAIGVVSCPPLPTEAALFAMFPELAPAFIELDSSFCSSYCSVDNHCSPEAYSRVSSHAFQLPTATNRPITASAGLHSGITICHHTRKWPAPSIFADSMTSSGMDFMYVLSTMRLNALIMTGTQ